MATPQAGAPGRSLAAFSHPFWDDQEDALPLPLPDTEPEAQASTQQPTTARIAKSFDGRQDSGTQAAAPAIKSSQDGSGDYRVNHPHSLRRIYYTSESGGEQLIIGPDGSMCDLLTGNRANGWYVREDGRGDRVHFEEGKIHREDGPAEIRSEERGTIWYRHGVMHREDGPALDIVTLMGSRKVAYYYHGEIHAEHEPAVAEIQEDGSQVAMFYHHGKLHRENGAALTMLNKDGEKIREEYYLNGVLHRDNGPAVIVGHSSEPQSKMYYQEGELHRLDGPAIIRKSGSEDYYLQGLQVDQKRVRQAYLDNRDAKVGKSEKSETQGLSEAGKREEMESRIAGWLTDRNRQKNKARRGNPA